MNTQPEHYSLNELIQLQDSGWDVNEKFGIDWTPVGTGAIHTFILINAAFSSATCADFLILSYFVCFLHLRGNWTINYKTKTTLCLFLLFMEDKNILSSLLTAPPPPHPSITSPYWMLQMCQPAQRQLRGLMMFYGNEEKFSYRKMETVRLV